MIYGSVCSGIEAASVAWAPLGWRAGFFAEIAEFPRAVLRARFPETPLHGDFTTIRAGDVPAIAVLVGGTPCQSFSVAGLRAGLADDRGNLALAFCRLAGRLRPRWIVWENVPGVLSSGGGRDFGSILAGLVECGYGLAWRVLDARYFGVPQRRRRVFLVGHLGDWRRAGAVLFEPARLSRHSAPGRQAPQELASGLTTRAGDGCQRAGGNGNLVVSPTLSARGNRTGGARPFGTCADTANGLIVHALRGEGFDASEDGTGRGTPLVVHGTQDPLASALAFPLGRNSGQENVFFGAGRPRRLTPRECERLQGFPDDWTLVPFRGRPAADGPRYVALGNSMAVPVMAWIGARIAAMEDRNDR